MNPALIADNNQVELNPNMPDVNQVEQLAQNPEIVPSNLRNVISPELWARLTYEQKAILTDLDQLPSKLQGIVPESVWPTLSFDQKIGFLYSRGIIPEGSIAASNPLEGSGFDGGMGEAQPEAWDQQPEGYTDQPEQAVPGHLEGEVDIAEGQNLKNEFHEAVQEVAELESSHKAEMETLEKQQPQPAVDMKHNLNTEVGKVFTVKAPKVSGYKPDESVINNPDQFTDGPASLGTSWIANILKKLSTAFSGN